MTRDLFVPSIRFTKMHGLGNDFVVLDEFAGFSDAPVFVDPALASRLADRHLGIGCDQLLLVGPPRLPGADAPGAKRAWAAFEKMMRSGPPPVHAAAALRRALLRNRSATVRTGRFFQAVAGPLLARLAPLALSRRIQARYFGLD